MRKIFLFLAVLFLAMPINLAFADCTATPEQMKEAQDKKAEAVRARDKGLYESAAKIYQEAAALHPMEVYVALDLLNAEGCLVGKFNPSKGYRYDTVKGENNKEAAQAILDKVKELMAKVESDGCEYDNDSTGSNVIDRINNWLENAQDALNGKFH
jgi:hypothetical protein